MSSSRASLSFNSTFLRPFLRTAPRSSIPISSRRFKGDYGSGEGDPKGENPQSQGPNPSADKEHPGPPSPSAGQGTGGGPTKGTSEGHNNKESPSSSTSGGTSTSGGSSGGSSKSKKSQGAQPKILSENPPPEDAEDVKKHNEDLASRAERADSKVSNEDTENDKVSKGFWSGE